MSLAYYIPKKDCLAEISIQKSRFIAQAFRIESREPIHKILDTIRAAHPKSRHNCYAFIAGAPTDTQAYGFSDDGEPNGTAGKPMLNVLMHSGVGEIMIVVTRYFGGIKLGTGGLVRAYSDATNEVLNSLPTQLKEEKSALQLSCSYAMEPIIRNILLNLEIHAEVDYSESVLFKTELTKKQKQQLIPLIAEYNIAYIEI